MIFTTWSFLACACVATSVIAAPSPLVPIHRVSKRALNGGYIVKFKDGVVPPANRRTWVDNQLNKAGLDPLTDDQVAALRTGWRSDVFDGFCGQLSEEAVNAFMATGDVDFIAEGMLSTTHLGRRGLIHNRWRNTCHGSYHAVSLLVHLPPSLS